MGTRLGVIVTIAVVTVLAVLLLRGQEGAMPDPARHAHDSEQFLRDLAAAPSADARWKIHMNAGRYFGGAGDHAESVQHYAMALTEASQWADEDPRTIDALEELAGQLEAKRIARPIFEAALARSEILFGKSHERTARLLEALAWTYDREAEDPHVPLVLMSRAVDNHELSNCNDNDELAGALSSLAYFQQQAGLRPLALANLQRSYAMYEKIGIKTGVAAYNPAFAALLRTLVALGDFGKAQSLIDSQIRTATSGDGHIIADSRSRLHAQSGWLALYTGDPKSALRELELAMALVGEGKNDRHRKRGVDYMELLMDAIHAARLAGEDAKHRQYEQQLRMLGSDRGAMFWRGYRDSLAQRLANSAGDWLQARDAVHFLVAKNLT